MKCSLYEDHKVELLIRQVCLTAVVNDLIGIVIVIYEAVWGDVKWRKFSWRNILLIQLVNFLWLTDRFK